MKILVTGFTRGAVTRDFHKTSELGVCFAHVSLVENLEALGHTVIQKPVTIGENLSSYDKVIVFLMHISPFNSYIYSALWTIAQRPDAIFAIEDWQSPKNISTWKKDVDKVLDSITNDYYVNNVVKEKTLKAEWKTAFRDAISRISEEDTTIILPAHLGGDYKKLFPTWNKDKVFAWYPPPYSVRRLPKKSGLFKAEKQKVFNFAGLIQGETEKWFNNMTADVTWEIKQYGSKAKKQVRLTEQAMVETFDKHWGILMAGYWHAGSGWWRARPQQTADVESILICDEREGAVFGEPYVGLNCKMLEDMDEGQLKKLASDQKIAYYDSQPMDKNISDQLVLEILDA